LILIQGQILSSRESSNIRVLHFLLRISNKNRVNSKLNVEIISYYQIKIIKYIILNYILFKLYKSEN